MVVVIQLGDIINFISDFATQKYKHSLIPNTIQHASFFFNRHKKKLTETQKKLEKMNMSSEETVFFNVTVDMPVHVHRKSYIN